MRLLMYILGGLFIILLLRLGYMQVLEGNKYRTMATQNLQRLVPVEAPRGEILDSNGVRIVSNKPVYTVSLVFLGVQDTEGVKNRLAVLLAGEEAFQGLTVEQVKEEINNKLKDHHRLYEPVKVAANVSQQTVNRIEEQRLELPGVNIDVAPVRYYPFKDLGGEVLGYVREITGEELAAMKDEGYRMGDMTGKVGIEKTYERFLRGKKGARQVEVDAQARPVRDLGLKEPVPGNNLVLTIDHRLQRSAQDAVAGAIARARQLGYARPPRGKVPSGAAVVQDIRTGRILAMASLPSYDLNIFSGTITGKKYSELVNSGALRNHAIQSSYTPGSTFKMVTASAFLEKGIVTPSTFIQDPGYYKYKKDWKPGGHGRVDVIGALKHSCDTFFYIYGARGGPELMSRYAREFGLGQPTGVDLPGEEEGAVASRELKKIRWGGHPDPRVREWESQWHEYDSMDMAIGQQENKYTAIQLVNYVSAIANGGTLYRPYLVEKITGPDGRLLEEFRPQEIKKIGVSRKTMDLVRQGMHEVTTTDGTAAGVFAGASYTSAAKTGTAEVGDAAKNNHALFVAYAPYENPEIAVSVIIEYGGKGSGIAGPAARQIMDAYFQLKKMPKPDQDMYGETGQPGDSTASGNIPGGAAVPGNRRPGSQPRENPPATGDTGTVPTENNNAGTAPGQGRSGSGNSAGTGSGNGTSGQGGVVPPIDPHGGTGADGPARRTQTQGEQGLNNTVPPDNNDPGVQ